MHLFEDYAYRINVHCIRTLVIYTIQNNSQLAFLEVGIKCLQSG